MNKHTKGPWDAKDWMVSNHPATPLKVICYTANNQASRTDENLANARLIAAAPEMYDALRMLTDATIKLAPYPPEVSEGVVAMVEIARAAIAKAEGRA